MTDEPDIDALVQSGQYASKGAARRALGINDDPPKISDNAIWWFKRLTAGFAGARPKLPNNDPR